MNMNSGYCNLWIAQVNILIVQFVFTILDNVVYFPRRKSQAKQLKDYENAVIAKRLEELDDDEITALVEEIERDEFWYKL